MIAVAARRRLTAYSDFVAERRSLGLEPQSDHLAHIPGETRRASTSMDFEIWKNYVKFLNKATRFCS